MKKLVTRLWRKHPKRKNSIVMEYNKKDVQLYVSSKRELRLGLANKLISNLEYLQGMHVLKMVCHE